MQICYIKREKEKDSASINKLSKYLTSNVFYNSSFKRYLEG